MAVALKICSSCNNELDITMFGKRKISKDGYRNQCKKCCNKPKTKAQKYIYNKNRRDKYAIDEECRNRKTISNNKYLENNSELVKYKSATYYENNKEGLKITNRIRSKEHYQLNKSIYKDNHKRWRGNNSHKVNSYTAKYRAGKLLATPSWANKKLIEDFYLKARELTEQTGIIYEVDHIYPLQGETVSGLHIETNLQVITRAKNRQKSNNLIK